LKLDLDVLLDLDGVVYDMHTSWLEWYNDKWNDNLTLEGFKDWDLHKWVKPECGKDIYNYLLLDKVFFFLPTFRGAIEAITKAHSLGVRQYFVSTCTVPQGAFDKMSAVERDFPFIGKKNVMITGGYKGLFSGDILFDDGPHNLVDFRSKQKKPACRVSIDNTAEYNKHVVADYLMTDWTEYVDILESVYDFKKADEAEEDYVEMYGKR